MCSPRNVAHTALNKFSKEALASFPVPTQTKAKKIVAQEAQKKKKVPKAMAGKGFYDYFKTKSQKRFICYLTYILLNEII